ncbi:hypothetical protein ACWDYJ_14935 [Streptomyces sp. NPDC003042]
MNASQRIGLGLVGALLAGGLLSAARAAPDDRTPAQDPGGGTTATGPSPPPAPAAGARGR